MCSLELSRETPAGASPQRESALTNGGTCSFLSCDDVYWHFPLHPSIFLPPIIAWMTGDKRTRSFWRPVKQSVSTEYVYILEKIPWAHCKKLSTVVPVTGPVGPWMCFLWGTRPIEVGLNSWLTDGSKFVSLTHRQLSTSRKHFCIYVSGIHFC
jgi:hypothetical protein